MSKQIESHRIAELESLRNTKNTELVNAVIREGKTAGELVIGVDY